MRRAFTLIEMVVVIGIIVLLAALTVAVSSTLTRKAEERQAEDTLRLLDMALQEWETAADRQLTYGTNGQPNAIDRYDIQADLTPGDADDGELTRRVLFRLLKHSGANAVLAQLDTDALRQHPDTSLPSELQRMIVDPWDKEYLVIFPGPLDSNVPAVDDDGTLRSEFENRYGICLNRKIVFVSAGPDGDFGDLQLNNSPSTPVNSAADDNMYSAPVKTRLP
jgi:prepilin-type N-terminal cleavage/methylation domain-containing protein